jgi:hypothetical protein
MRVVQMSRPIRPTRPYPADWRTNTLEARGWAEPAFEPYKLWFVGATFAAAIAASAVVGIVNAITRSWPETFTTDQD